MTQRLQSVALVGNGHLEPTDPRVALAFECGRLIIDSGYRLVCGGLGGAMAAACSGARSSERWREGLIVGILPGSDPAEANDDVDIVIPTGLGHARNFLVAHADAMIAVGGEYGTLSEVAHASTLRRPVVALRTDGWSGRLAEVGGSIIAVTTPAEAIRAVINALSAGADHG